MLERIQKASHAKRKMMLIGLIGAIIVIFLVIRFLGSEDTWICDNGKWVKHGSPQAPKPTEACPKSII